MGTTTLCCLYVFTINLLLFLRMAVFCNTPPDRVQHSCMRRGRGRSERWLCRWAHSYENGCSKVIRMTMYSLVHIELCTGQSLNSNWYWFASMISMLKNNSATFRSKTEAGAVLLRFSRLTLLVLQQTPTALPISVQGVILPPVSVDDD